MDRNDKQLILQWVKGSLSRADFINQYPVDLTNPDEYIINGLQSAFDNKDAEAVELFLLLLPFSVQWKSVAGYPHILGKLLIEEWHISHENIASLLQGIKSPATVDSLYEACFLQLEYMDYDDSYSLARKCIHALGDINTEYSKEKLRLLATSEIDIIKEKAEKQLYYYKR